MITRIFLLMVVSVATAVSQIPHYDVTMSQSDYELLYTRDIFSDTYLPCTFDFQSSHWINVQVRFKGHSTRYYSKKSINVKFPTSNLFQNIRTISFNAMYSDKSSLREHLAWDLFEDMGALASRPHYGTLAINGVSKGLFLFIDKPDRYVLQNRGRVVGPMYEASDTYISSDLTPQPDSLLKLYYEKAIGDANDYTDLKELINALNSAPDESFADTVHKYFEIQSVLNWFAGNILTMMGDSYNKNYLLYRDTSKPAQQWVVIPWDYDLSFGRTGDPTVPYPADLLNDRFAYSFPPLEGASNILKDRFWGTPSLREELRRWVDTVLSTDFTEARQHARIDSLVAAIGQEIQNDPYRWGTYSEFLEHAAALKFYVTARRNYLYRTFINAPSGLYDDVTLPVNQINTPYHFVGYDGMQFATLRFDSMSGLDSVRVEAYPDSTPANVPDPPGARFVRRWVRITPYPSTATFLATVQWSYLDVAGDYREVGTGVQDEHYLRPFVHDVGGWRGLRGEVNAHGNFVTIDSVTESDCAPGTYFALLMSETYAQQWNRQPLTNWQRWYDVGFIDQQIGLVIGDHGTILRTTDGGSSWTEASLGFNLPMHRLAIPSPDNILAIGEYGRCFQSADSGKSWMAVDVGTRNALNGIDFEDAQVGWIYGEKGTLLRSTDAGTTWLPFTQNTSRAITCVLARTGQIILCDDSGELRQSVNDGITWTLIGNFPDRILAGTDQGGSMWLVGEQGSVIRPAGGITWQVKNIPASTTLRDIHLLDKARLYVVGDDGSIYYSADTGSTWHKQYSADAHDLFGITFTDSTHGYAVGSGGTILTTTSGGTVTGAALADRQLPAEFELMQNYPNPFNPATRLSFVIGSASGGSLVTLKIYDVLGREVATVVDEHLKAGSYTRTWSAQNLASGVYFCRLQVSGSGISRSPAAQIRKMLLVR